MASFWDQECKPRGPALTHAHWSRCDPAGFHPGTTDRHLDDQCCHCGERAASWQPQENRQPVVPVVRQVRADHAYQFTIAGRCGAPGCGRVQDDHPLMLDQPDPLTACVVDHASITSKQLIGDDGLSWSTCPKCGVQVEPKLATGAAIGRPYGRGRLPFTRRHLDELSRIRNAWLAGYWLS